MDMRECKTKVLLYCSELGCNIVLERAYSTGELVCGECLSKERCDYIRKGCRNKLFSCSNAIEKVTG